MGETGRLLLLTNDDGIDAPGLASLISATAGLGQIQVIAPLGAQSGCGHAVATHRDIEVHRQPNGLAVDSTPADCVRLGLHHLVSRVDWVVSGINAGGNLGVDVFHSGTVAAAREAVIHGIPGVAVSHYIARGRTIDWDQAARWARRALEIVLARPWRSGTLWHVNLPHPEPGSPEPEIVFCQTDPSPLPLTYRVEGDWAQYAGDYRSRARRPGSDVDVCLGGRIAISLISLLDSIGAEVEGSGLVEPGGNKA